MMQVRPLGHSGLNVFPLAFGTLTISPMQKGFSPERGAELMLYAAERGVNLFDTAQLYDTYEPLRLALKKRPDLLVSTKSYAWDRQTAQEAFDDALMFEFEVKSAQDKVENDFACQNLMLVFEDGRATFIPYPAPLGAWEKRRVQIAADDKGPGPVKAFRLGANPNGTRCTFWLRSLRILKTKK